LAARELRSPAERGEFLDRACAGDAGLRAEAEALLAAGDRAGDFLQASGPVVTVDQPLAERVGSVIGPYKLLEQIGEGGMGSVWMAQQTEPVKRLVAVKLIKAGMDTKQVIARFGAERQALALMDHANIARVLDAGTTAAGRPYFVMDLVKGVPITRYCDVTRYCDEHRLTPRQRLELFLPVCQAVQHAHQKGIIHRDLKPSNVLVAQYDGRPVPKVIDFGVAKAAGPQLTEKTLVTGFGAIVGTLEYMSPEQAEVNQLDIDTRSDIYSLGVLLYELLTGGPPFTRRESEQGGVLEMLRMIREQEPTRPSAKLSTADGLPTLAADRGTEPGRLPRLVRGELDWIVMKALEKDRNRRYETANGFALDVERYLADETVLACPPSAGYRLRKFARRNKAGLAVAALVLFFLVLLGTGIGWAVRDRAARQSRTGAQADLILADVEQLEIDQKWPEALAAARRAQAAVVGGEADAATAQRVRDRLTDLEFIDRLEQIRMQRGTTIASMINTAETDRAYAAAFRDYGIDVETLAVETSVERLKARPKLAIPIAAALDDWVHFQAPLSEGDSAGRQRLLVVARGIDPEPLRDRMRSTPGPPSPEERDELRRLAESINVRAHHPATLFSLTFNLQKAQFPDLALRILRDAVLVYPGDYWLNVHLGVVLALQKDRVGAVRFFTAAVSIRPNATSPRRMLGLTLQTQMRLDEAAAVYREVIRLDPKDDATRQRLCKILREQKKLDEAVAGCEEAIAHNPTAAWAYLELGHTLRAQKKLEAAGACYRKVIELDPTNAAARQAFGWILREQGKLDEAAAWLKAATARDPNATWAHRDLGSALRQQGKLGEAVASYHRAIELSPEFAENYEELGFALQQQGKPSEAIAAHEKVLSLAPRGDRAHKNLAWLLTTCPDPRFRDPGRAVALARKAVELAPKNGACATTLGVAYYRAGDWKAAITALERSMGLRDGGNSFDWFFLAMAHSRLGENDKARELYDRALQWMDKNQPGDDELRRFRAEAAELLRLNEES
jgi:serine/threonine protein kinase/tetratricopeptide (TPR) repeat protein